MAESSPMDAKEARSSVVSQYKMTLFSEFTYSSVNQLISYGAANSINVEDIPNVPLFQTSESTDDVFECPWNQQLREHPDNPNIKIALFVTFGRYFCFACYYTIGFIILSGVQPFIITMLLEYVSIGHYDFFGIELESGVAIAFLLGLISWVNAFLLNASMYYCYTFAMTIKSCLIARIFKKSLLISNYAKANRNVGEIITLMSVDVERIWFGTLLLPWLLLCPLMISVAAILLVIKMTYSAVFVCVLLISLALVLEEVSKRIGNIRVDIVRHTVERTLLVNEALQGIRVVKMYAWEKIIQDKINIVRRKEVILLRKYLIYKIIIVVSTEVHIVYYDTLRHIMSNMNTI
jgi:ABC-type multidrug transport system fused ATPase/permease subunit